METNIAEIPLTQIDLAIGTEFQINFRDYKGKTLRVVGTRDIDSPVGLQHDCELNNLPRGLKSDSWVLSAAALGAYRKMGELSILNNPTKAGMLSL